MSIQHFPGPRGIMAVRADASDANKILAELLPAFKAFKDENDKALADLRKGKADVVQTEKIDRINADITSLQAGIDQVNAALAAARLGGGSGSEINADQKAHKAGFEAYFRKGAETGLRDLEVKAAATTDNDPNGGYLVDATNEQTIDRVLSTVSAIRSLATVLPISTGSYKKLVGQGGATAGWVGEKATRTETTTPTLSDLVFNAMELYANPAATQQALDDARIDIGAWLADEVSTVFAEKEGLAFFSGDGVNSPRGISSYTMIADASYAWGKVGFNTSGVAAALSDSTHNGADAITDLVYALKQGYRTNGRFLMNRTTQAAVRKLKSKTEELYLWQPSIQAGQPPTLLGYPVVDDDNVSDIGANAFPIWFGDFKRAYLIVDRAGIRVLRDPYTNKPYVHFYTTKRVGGGIQNFEALKALKIST